MKLFYERYIKLAHIGRGANAHVYKVKHAELGYIRAIKVLNDYIEDKNDRIYKSFIKECQTLLTIGNGCHPNIVRIYGPDLIDNKAIVEMDCIQGITLDSYIKEKGFIDYEEIKTFLNDIVGALAYTHVDIYKFLMDPEIDNLEPDPNDGSKFLISKFKEEQLVKKYGISHNDLHSNNVMRRDYDGRFVLLDFGLAVQDGRCIKSSRVGDGNPEYQAPEKFDSDRVSPRTDIYSLGILMYEMLAGRVPFELQYDAEGRITPKALNDVLNKHNSATPEAILPLRKSAFEKTHPGQQYQRDYPEWLDTVIMKCLSKKPEDRYSDARALLNDITAHLSEDKPDPNAPQKIASLEKTVSDLTDKLNHEKSVKENVLLQAAAAQHEKQLQIESAQALEEQKNLLENENKQLKEQLGQARKKSPENLENLNKKTFEEELAREKEQIEKHYIQEKKALEEENKKLKEQLEQATSKENSEPAAGERISPAIYMTSDSLNQKPVTTSVTDKKWKIGAMAAAILFVIAAIWGIVNLNKAKNYSDQLFAAQSILSENGIEMDSTLTDSSIRSESFYKAQIDSISNVLASTTDSLNSEIESLRNSSAKTTGNNESDEIKRLKAENSTLNNKVKSLEKSAKSTPAASNSAEINKLKSEIKSLNSQIATLKSKQQSAHNSTNEQELKRLRQENANLKAKLSRWESGR